MSEAKSGPICLGFLSFVEENGVKGGLFLTNSWGRPVEFRISSAVQPNQVQKILYGPTLQSYLYAEVISKTLLEKSATKADLILTDHPAALTLRHHVEVPVLFLAESDPPEEWAGRLLQASHPHTEAPLCYEANRSEDAELIAALLGKIDTALDLAEPFSRVREAMTEATKMGVNQRAA